MAARVAELANQNLQPLEAVLEHAAIVGRTFSRSAVAALLPGDATGLDAQLEATTPKRDIGRPRLPVDRSFTIAGFGTVVTGTLIDGSLIEVVAEALLLVVLGSELLLLTETASLVLPSSIAWAVTERVTCPPEAIVPSEKVTTPPETVNVVPAGALADW